MNEVKLLRVWFNNHLSFSVHVDHVLSTVSQRMYLLNRLRRPGLDPCGLNIVFNALIISKLSYACQDYSGFLSSTDIGRLQASLNKAHKFKLSKMILERYLKAVMFTYVSRFCRIQNIVYTNCCT